MRGWLDARHLVVVADGELLGADAEQLEYLAQRLCSDWSKPYLRGVTLQLLEQMRENLIASVA